jgi:hypothetical protein
MRKTPKHHGWRSGLAVAGGGRQPLDRHSLQEAERGLAAGPCFQAGTGLRAEVGFSSPAAGCGVPSLCLGITGQEAASGVGHWRSLGRGRGGRAQTGAMVWCTWSALKVGCWAISHTVTQIHIKFLVSRPNTAQYTDMHWIHIHIGIRTTAPCWRVCVSGWTPQSRVPQIRTDARDGLVAWLDKICLHKLLDLS